MEGTELVVAMTKSNGPGRTVGPHRVESKNDLASAPGPTSMLDYVAFADVLGGENRRAIRREAEGEDSPGGIGRGCMTLVGT